MEQLKIGDLVRRDETMSCAEVEGLIEDVRSDGTISGIRVTKENCHYKIFSRMVPAQSSRYQKFYLISQPKHPPIKTKFLGGYIE